MKKHYVIIVLGLGEGAPLYRFLIRGWQRKYGLIPIIHVVGWKSKRGQFDEKLHQLQSRIETLAHEGHAISIISISAGASIALVAYVRLKQQGIRIKSYASVCGRFNFQHHWWYPLWYGVKRVPTFQRSVSTAQTCIPQLQAEDYLVMACFFSVFDEVVPVATSTLEQASRHIIPIPFHHLAIYSLFAFPKRLIKQLTILQG